MKLTEACKTQIVMLTIDGFCPIHDQPVHLAATGRTLEEAEEALLRKANQVLTKPELIATLRGRKGRLGSGGGGGENHVS